MDKPPGVRKVTHKSDNPQRRLRNSGNDMRQLVTGPASGLKHSTVELRAVCQARIFDKLLLFRRSAKRRRLHAKPARGFRKIANRHHVPPDLAEKIDVVAVRKEEWRANSQIFALRSI